MDKIISLDETKIWYEHTNSGSKVYKISSVKEKENLLKTKSFIKDKHLKVNERNYCIKVPDVYSWNSDNNTLCMSYCEGDNLELLLRDPKYRDDALPFLQSMFRFIMKEHFYWEDFAPRNIILNDDIIYLVDFEKNLNFEINDKKSFLRNHVFEEYSSFLLPNERIINADQVFSPSLGEYSQNINVNDIKVKRIKYVALALGYSNYITKATYLNIQKMIIKAEEPFIEDEKLKFPRIDLVKMLENKNVDSSVYIPYANIVLAKNNIKPINKEER